LNRKGFTRAWNRERAAQNGQIEVTAMAATMAVSDREGDRNFAISSDTI
jgi:hypothetical protein